MTDPKKKIIIDNESDEATEYLPFKKIDNESDEAESDGSGNAFDETENVTEDNFDDLKEK